MTKHALKSFDLSVFDIPSIPLNQVCAVISIDLSKVIEDPDQPRKIFNQEDLDKFSQEIAVRGVMSPIQVKSADKSGLYQIIQGARRYRASLLAGLKTIPAIVRTDEALFDDYSQVTENTQRENLSPLDIARFIAKRKEQGESNVQIAENLNESKDYVGKHLALLDAPDFIQEALLTGVITGMQSAYHLLSLHKKDPNAAKGLLVNSEHVATGKILTALKTANQIMLRDVASVNETELTPPPSVESEEIEVPSVSTDITSDFGQDLPKQDLQQKNSFAVVRTNQGAKFDKKIAKGFVQNLSLQLGNKAAGQIVFNHSEAQTLKSLLEGLL